MTKELEALKTIKIKCHPNSNPSPIVDEALEIIEQALIKAQKQEKKIAEYKRVLEIIKKKKVNIDLLYASSNAEQYNDELVRVYGMWFVKDRQLTQEEFDTLKRWTDVY
ncbi:MAG: hypothetical protein IKF82_01000 [Bacilli bacterium]|nr:hypothetical protein [Bacilli bacterium]